MKNLMFAILPLWLVIAGCNLDRAEVSASGNSPLPGLSLISSSCEISLHLDMETYYFRRPANQAQGTISYLDSVAGIPVIRRMEVQYCGNLTGEGEWLMENKTPTVSIPFDHEPRPDDSPQFRTAHVSNQVLRVYDQEGNLMEGVEIDLPGLNQLLTFLPGGRPQLWQQAVSTLQAEGTVITEIPGSFMAIRKTDSGTGNDVVFLLNLEDRVLNGVSTYTASGELIFRVIFDYDDGQEPPVIKGMHQVEFESSASSGVDMVSETHTLFHSFSFQKNQ
ncbi:MAG: hypothetical protein SF052_24085 [Bacteroidia bacterium]|nr:hypothetical protein [Bacteroidia bacterium]